MHTDSPATALEAAMISIPKTCPATTTVAQVRDDFLDDYLHCVLIFDGSVLLAVVERPDLVGARPEALAVSLGRLHGRVVSPGEALEPVRAAMLKEGRRRLAVVDDRGSLLGLLCLKRTGLGFCSDSDVRARAAERAANAQRPMPWTRVTQDFGGRSVGVGLALYKGIV